MGDTLPGPRSRGRIRKVSDLELRQAREAGDALDRPTPDRAAAAGHLARLVGEIRLV